MTVKQSWSKISIAMNTQSSTSSSTSASLEQEPTSGFKLLYSYENNPSVAAESLHRHSGVATVRFDAEAMTANAEYFTGHTRMTAGSMKWERQR